MAKRNFSMTQYWNERFKDWQPELSFKGSSKQDFDKWQKTAYDKLLSLLGDFPEKVGLEAEVEYSVRDKDLIRERVVFDVDEYMSIPCQVLKPVDMKSDGSNAAILCSHGHGAYGKDPVAGMRSGASYSADIERMNYNYAEQMAKAGYLTITPDLRVFGERGDGDNPFPGRDKCNVNFIKGAMLGVYTLSLNIFDLMRCVDYLQTRPEVDPGRIGMMGLSQGGTMTTFTTAVDKRIKAADIIGYVNPWNGFAINRANFCGSQIVPEVYKYFDTHDIAGMIAPRPLLLEMGIYDVCFYLQDLIKGYEGTKKIYEAAGAGDVIYKDIHPRPHAFSGDVAFEFFAKHL